MFTLFGRHVISLQELPLTALTDPCDEAREFHLNVRTMVD